MTPEQHQDWVREGMMRTIPPQFRAGYRAGTVSSVAAAEERRREKQSRVVELYRQGVSLTAIGEQIGGSEFLVKRILREAGVIGAEGKEIIGPDGKRYPSHTALAEAYGVTTRTLRLHLKKYGHLRNLGRSNSKPVTGPDGTVYSSQSAAARALGVDLSTVWMHLRKYGNLDRCGIGQGNREGLASDPRAAVEIDGRTWPSIASFARHVGRSKVTIRGWLVRGEVDKLRAALAAVEGRA